MKPGEDSVYSVFILPVGSDCPRHICRRGHCTRLNHLVSERSPGRLLGRHLHCGLLKNVPCKTLTRTCGYSLAALGALSQQAIPKDARREEADRSKKHGRVDQRTGKSAVLGQARWPAKGDGAGKRLPQQRRGLGYLSFSQDIRQ